MKGRPFVVVPYTLGMNDIVDYGGRNFSAEGARVGTPVHFVFAE